MAHHEIGFRTGAVQRAALKPYTSAAREAEAASTPYFMPDDVPVFDKGHAQSHAHHLLATGLKLHNSNSNESRPFLFTRNVSDARPGTTVPCGEPRPDRHAISDALRAQIEAKEAKWKLATGTPAEGTPRAARGPYRKSTSQTTDIPEPLGRYIEASNVVIIGRRGGRALLFGSPREAVVCMTGKPATQQGLNAVTNAANNVVRGAYGWSWERVGRASTAKLQYRK